MKPNSDHQGGKTLKDALEAGWLQVSKHPPKELLLPLLQILDAGESEAIALAQINENSVLIIDERRGRNVATQRNIKIIGTGAVLLAAKQKQYIDNVKEPLQALSAVGYRLSPSLRQRLLLIAGEATG